MGGGVGPGAGAARDVSAALVRRLLTAFTLLFWQAGGAFPLAYVWQAGLTATAAVAVWLCTASGRRAGPVDGVVEVAGDASYSTYLFQTFGAQAALAVGSLAPPSWRPVWLLLLLAVVAANLLGWAIFTYVERPLTRRLRAMLLQAPPAQRRTAGAPPA